MYKLNRIIPNITLMVLLAVSVLIFILFYGGGDVDTNEELVQGLSQPVYTDLLMKYMYVLFGIALSATLVSAVLTFIIKLDSNPKSAIVGLIGIGAMGLLALIAWSLSDATPLSIVGFDGEQTATDLIISDMSLYIIYILFTIALIVSGLSFFAKRFS